MKFRVLMIALVTVLTGTAAARAEPFAAPEPQPIRLMSYNIRYDAPDDRPNWPERRPHMARQIAFFAPDVLGVQEALIPMVAYLAEQAPDYDHYGLGRDDGAEGARPPPCSGDATDSRSSANKLSGVRRPRIALRRAGTRPCPAP